MRARRVAGDLLTSTLVGEVSGDTLLARFVAARCGPVPVTFLRGGLSLYELDDQNNSDPPDDTLFDGLTLWHRV